MSLLLFYILVFILAIYSGNLVRLVFKRILGKGEIPITLLPVAGMAFLICLSQLLFLVFPAKVIACVVLAMFIASVILSGFSFLKEFWEWAKQNRVFCLIVFGVFVAFSYPILKGGDLLSFQYSNNDIIFYLSTDDWMVDHSYFQNVEFSNNRPYYALADYILKSTRFGTDIIESVIMCMLRLKSHQIFSAMGVVYIVLAAFIGYFFLKNVFKISSKFVSFAILPVAFHSCWKELLVQTYVPQIAGVCFLMAFVAFLMKYILQEEKTDSWFASLFLAATACTYAEYSSYMFIIYVGFFAIQIAYTKKIVENLKNALILGIRGFLFNPFGFIIAVIFNLRTFLNVSESGASIDAFHGVMKHPGNIAAQIFGTMDISRDTILRIIILIFLCLLFVSTILFCLFNKREKVTALLLWVLLFFFLYEVYFRISGIGYGEFKHLIGIGPLCVLFLLYFIITLSNGKWRLMFWAVSFVITICNLNAIRCEFPTSSLFYFDDQVAGIQDGAELIPADQPLGILANSHVYQHQMIYGSKNHNVQLIGEGINSYYPEHGVELTQELSNYILTPKNYSGADGLHCDYDIVWENEKFQIVTNIQNYKTYEIGAKIDFSGEDADANNYIISGLSHVEAEYTWTEGSQVLFTPLKFSENSTSDNYEMIIYVENVINDAQELEVIINGQSVLNSDVENEDIISVHFTADSSENVMIEFKIPEAISPVELNMSSDSRQLGLAISGIVINEVG